MKIDKVNKGEEVLSLPAKGTYDLISRTLVHAHPIKKGYNYRYTDVMTFRNKGGIMEFIYDVEEYIDLIPSYDVDCLGLNIDKAKRLKEYINERASSFGFKYEQNYRFYFLKIRCKLDTPFIQRPNLQSASYYYLGDIYNAVAQDMKDNCEIDENELSSLYEGAKKQIFVNAYERNTEARQRCIKYYGTKCFICGFESKIVYGENFEGKIQVHHRKALSEINDEYIVDPIKDLVPLCANCHMIIHSKAPAYTIEEIQEIVEAIKNKKDL